MKKRLAVLVTGSALCLLAANAAAQTALAARPAVATQAAEDHAGYVKSVQGTVYMTGSSGVRRAVKSGEPVGTVDRIETEADSGASVVLRDGTVMVIGPSSHLDLNKFSFDSTTQEGGLFISLLRGSMRMVTGLLGKKPESIRIDTQTATIGIRGTDFILSSDAKI